jgi:hypothetical protein
MDGVYMCTEIFTEATLQKRARDGDKRNAPVSNKPQIYYLGEWRKPSAVPPQYGGTLQPPAQQSAATSSNFDARQGLPANPASGKIYEAPDQQYDRDSGGYGRPPSRASTQEFDFRRQPSLTKDQKKQLEADNKRRRDRAVKAARNLIKSEEKQLPKGKGFSKKYKADREKELTQYYLSPEAQAEFDRIEQAKVDRKTGKKPGAMDDYQRPRTPSDDGGDDGYPLQPHEQSIFGAVPA